MAYRVVYGESRPAWEKRFKTRREAEAYAVSQLRCGDIIFRVSKVKIGEEPQSLMAAIEAAKHDQFMSKVRT